MLLVFACQLMQAGELAAVFVDCDRFFAETDAILVQLYYRRGIIRYL